MLIETVLDFRATIGESPTWVADERALYCIDVKAPALHRYCPDDQSTFTWPVTSDIDLPVSQPTMPAFAGANLATLYLTSASDQMSAEAKAKEPLAGGLFRLDIGRRGVARPFRVR